MEVPAIKALPSPLNILSEVVNQIHGTLHLNLLLNFAVISWKEYALRDLSRRAYEKYSSSMRLPA